MVATGVAADGRKRWAVVSVEEWCGDSRNREARVCWAGFNVDHTNASEWAESCVPRALLSKDLRKLGRLRPYKKREEMPRPAADTGAPGVAEGDSGRRVSPRLGGLIPGHGLEVNAAMRAVRTRIVRVGGTEGSGEDLAAGTLGRRRGRE